MVCMYVFELYVQSFCNFRGAIAKSLNISTVSATFIPFTMYWNCNRLAQRGGGGGGVGGT